MKSLVICFTLVLVISITLFAQPFPTETPEENYPSTTFPNILGAAGPKKVPRFYFPEIETLTNIITASFNNTDVQSILALFRRELANYTVVISPKVFGRNVSVDFKNTSISKALEIVSRLADIYILVDKNTIFFLSYDEYEKILKDNFMETRFYDLRFVSPKDVKEFIKTTLTPIGDVLVDIKNNAVLIKDVKFNFMSIENLLREIGVSPKVVMIKVEIWQIDRNDTLDYGLDLKIDNIIKSLPSVSLSGPSINTESGLFSVKIETGAPDGGTVSSIIKALSKYGNVKLISTPRVACRNGEKAKILIGDKIPYIKSIIKETSQTGSTTSQLDFVEVGINLEVEPRITISGEIAIDVSVGISSHRFIDLSSDLKAPQINTTEGKITVVSRDGIPIIVGGLEKINEVVRKSGIPLLKDIPVIGDILFSSTSKENTKSTILIVLTPEIIDYNLPQTPYIEKDEIKVK